ncbi:sialidase [Paenibacillus agaridevorans]|uniref:Sialidase n=1 Tax=Paenibacillus agaridevorans TaxID=171404 RepID=A0A2R5EIQ3_9BACL|nr:sialidase family protein [Paenibacillus agaridevorans]GBG06490.1 sialidase [Paenibacillus agaridevorans]
MTGITVMNEGILYRNPLPHVYSRHAYSPSIVAGKEGELIASFAIGQAFEAEDLHSCIARSVDGGETWEFEGRLYSGTMDRVTSDVCRLSIGEEGEIVAFVIRHNRSRHEQGLTNPDNMGFVDIELLLFRSRDGGRSWGDPEALNPPLVGPAFEMTSPIVPLRDGSWLLPTSTWRGWDGHCPNGMRMVALQSGDGGHTWPSYLDVMVDESQDIIYWESKIIELIDGRLLAAAWAYDETNACDLPNQYALSEGVGTPFSAPRSTGLLGQTLNIIQLENGKILTVYRRMDEPGLWANIARLDDGDWINEQQVPLWGKQTLGLTASGPNMSHNFTALKFGAPSLCRLQDGSYYVVFWAVEDGVSNIRWLKLSVG